MLTDDEAEAKLLPMSAAWNCEGWEVGCLIDPGSEGDGEGILLLSVVVDAWPETSWMILVIKLLWFRVSLGHWRHGLIK